jgi:hypothetical protein
MKCQVLLLMNSCNSTNLWNKNSVLGERGLLSNPLFEDLRREDDVIREINYTI